MYKKPCGDDRHNGTPVEFLPKDDCTLQGHLGPHCQAPDVGSGNDEPDDECGFHRGEQIMFSRPNTNTNVK